MDPPSNPALLRAVPVGSLPTVTQHFLNPSQTYWVIWSELPYHLLCGKFGVPLPYRTDADSCSSPAINMPPNQFLRRASLGGGGHPTFLQVHLSAPDTQRMLKPEARYHLLRGAFRVLLPYRPQPSSYHFVL
jgi:hypothetical protein